MSFTVKELIGKRGLPITASPDELVTDALARMREHEFNQLPVVAEDRRPLGMVTHASVVRSLGFLGAKLDSLRVREAMDQKFVAKEADEDLFDLLDELGDTYALLIVDGEERLTGIVTSYDATEFFRGRYEDLMVVEDIESTLKDLIRIAFMSEAGEVDDAALGKLVADTESGRLQQRKVAQKVLGRYLAASEASSSGSRFDEVLFREVFDKTVPADRDRTLDDPNLGEFIQMFLDGGRWDVFKDVLGLDRESIRGLLEGVRKTRNRLAHFREAPTAHERDRLRYCSELLTPARRRLAQRQPGGSVLLEPLALSPIAPLSTEQVELGAEMVQPEDSRYARLALYLQGQPGGTEAIALPFRRIEEIIGGRLPDSARVHRAWWANDTRSHIQARQWLDVGWRVSDISINEERV
ncbi:MAG: CBS domain-containing protein, partial [Archangium sp.]